MRHVRSIVAVVAGALIFSCGKTYLTRDPLGQLDEADITNKKGVERLLIGAYSLLDGIGGNKSLWYSAGSNWLYGSICGSEAYKGSDVNDQGPELNPIELFTHTANAIALASKWGTVYDGVSRANDVLRIMKKAKDIDANDQKRIAAEARFLRGHYHFEAKKIWNRIPFVDETITYENGNYHVGNEKDAWLDIENDLRFAMDNLDVNPFGGAVGRATRYTAMALLVKAYIYQKKFALAKPLLEAIINSGRFKLKENYADNFNPETKNNSESIFSVQVSVNDGAGGMNGNFGDVLNFPVGGPGGCCGFFSPSQYLVNHFKTDATTGLPDLDNFNDVPVDSDDGLESTDQFIPYPGSLDPRLDWTVGRRGIPYLDWGEHPGKDWIRDPVYAGPYSPKKNVYYQSQQGHLTDVSFWSNGTTTNNINLIRYADVLLWAAEVEIETGDIHKGRNYINEVRNRAANTSGWVKNSSGSFAPYAANYKIGLYPADNWTAAFARKALRYERMLELGMEGHRFFDLVRWGIAAGEITAYKEKEKNIRAHLRNLVFRPGVSEYFAIPQLQIDLSAGADGIPKMKQNPGY